MRNLLVQDLGLKAYKEAWDYQEAVFANIIAHKMRNREREKAGQTTLELPDNHLLFCEHPHVYTLGKSGDKANLLIDEAERIKQNISFYPINRGGDITYHGPGQMVVYPLLDLDQFFTDIHKYLRYLEEAIILTMEEYGLIGERYPGYTGVWLDVEHPEKARKICAMGVKCSRWVTMHGLAFNVNTELQYFKNIVPCGIDDKAVTSMEQELGDSLNMDKVKQQFLSHFKKLFQTH